VRVLVCGGRAYKNRKRVYRLLKNLHEIFGDELVVIHGNASGADTLADDFCRENHIKVDVYPAKWDEYGKKAGVLRNQQMLVDGDPNCVIAFPGGTGTAHMCKIARKSGMPVLEVKEKKI
jgi:hypothetical protein